MCGLVFIIKDLIQPLPEDFKPGKLVTDVFRLFLTCQARKKFAAPGSLFISNLPFSDGGMIAVWHSDSGIRSSRRAENFTLLRATAST